MAKDYALSCFCSKQPHVNSQLLYEFQATSIKKVKQVNIDSRQLYDVICEEGIIDYWATHHDFKLLHSDKVNWEAFSTAMRSLPKYI